LGKVDFDEIGLQFHRKTDEVDMYLHIAKSEFPELTEQLHSFFFSKRLPAAVDGSVGAFFYSDAVAMIAPRQWILTT